MKMKKIGMLFDDQVALNAAFYMKAHSVLAYNENATVNTGTRTIEYPDMRWQFILLNDDKDVVKISGMEFDAIFSEVRNSNAKQFIMSRFRPRFDK
jgi:hypothetical protein